MKLQINLPEDFLQYQLQKAIAEAVNRLQGLSLKPEEVHLEHPENEEFGDYATNVALKLKGEILRLPDSSHRIRRAQDDTIALKKFSDRVKSKTPMELAEEIVKELKNNITIKQYSYKIQAVKPGFVNISIKNEWFIKELQRVLKKGEEYGRPKTGKNKKVMVEYAHPNTHKQFHIGHLRNISLGEAIARILEASGFEIIRTNYQGDVGLHIAKCLYGYIKKTDHEGFKTKHGHPIENADPSIKMKVLGWAYVMGNKEYEEDKKSKGEIKDINFLIYAAAQKFQQEKGVFPGSTDYLQFVKGKKEKLNEIYQLWKETRQWSLDYFERIYKRVYTKYNRRFYESECLEGVDLAHQALKKGVLKKSKGAIVFDGSSFGLDTRVFVNSLGLPTYEGKELKLAQLEFSKFGQLEKNIHVVGPEQTSFFKVTFKVEELLEPEKYKDKQFHLVYGWVRLKKGKMSSRLGTVITGEGLLDKARGKIKKAFPKTSEEVAEKIAIGAVKYSFLKVSPGQDLVFDFKESISLEGNSGPYLQYTYARCKSVLRKAREKEKRGLFFERSRILRGSREARTKSVGCVLDYARTINSEESAILRWLYRFPETVLEAGQNYSPNLICHFLYELAQKYNTFYNKHPILGPNKEQKKLRLLLTAASAQILKNGLFLLGIKSLEKM